MRLSNLASWCKCYIFPVHCSLVVLCTHHSKNLGNLNGGKELRKVSD